MDLFLPAKVFLDMRRMLQQGAWLNGDLHLVYQLTPPMSNISSDWQLLGNKVRSMTPCLKPVLERIGKSSP